MKRVFCLLFFAQTLMGLAHAADGPEPLPGCMEFLLPTYGSRVQILPREAREAIRRHPITKLAELVHHAGVRLEFETRSIAGGYLVQSDMIERILREIFPDAYRPAQPYQRTRYIRLVLRDTALNDYWWSKIKSHPVWKDPTVFEMSRVKAGNPLLPVMTREAARGEFGIPANARLLHVYLNHDHLAILEALLRADPSSPDYIILSFNKRPADFRRLKGLKDWQILPLSTLPQTLPPKALLLNDLRFRMMDLYRAADYAFVIGANNLFEPLRARCPTLFFKNSWPERFPGLNSPVSYYHPSEWNRVAALAERTGGAVGIASTRGASSGFRRLLEIRPEDIQNPAFTPLAAEGPTPFEELLDAIEANLRAQLDQGAVLYSR